MGKVVICNLKYEDCSVKENSFYCGRSKNGNPLGNPYTHNGVKTSIAKLTVPTREEAIKAYEIYFDTMYGKDEALTKAFDNIYEHYRNGEDIYLQCFCKPLPCHCDIIAERLQRKLIKEKLAERKLNQSNK